MTAAERLDVDGASIRVWRTGSGRPGAAPLVYLHSEFGEFGALPLFGRLAGAGLDVLAPELPGFGESDPVTGWRRIEDAVFTVRRILDRLGVGRAVLAGSSLGGWLAAETAVWFPDRVAALALLGPYGLRLDGTPALDLFSAAPDDLRRLAVADGSKVHTAYAPALPGPDDQDAASGADAPDRVKARLLQAFRAQEATARIAWNPYLHDPALRARLPLITAPTLILYGEQDGILPRTHAEAYTAAIPGARLRILADCAHLPAIEQPQLTAEYIVELSETSA